jgi:hypothetical protein
MDAVIPKSSSGWLRLVLFFVVGLIVINAITDLFPTFNKWIYYPVRSLDGILGTKLAAGSRAAAATTG